MKKYLLKTVVSAVLGFSLIFAGCSADDGGSGGLNAVLSAVSLKAADDVTSISAGGSVKLTATVTGENLSNSEIRYVWTVDGEDYASLDGELTSTAKSLTAEKTLTANNTTTSGQTVKVTVKTILGSTVKESSIELTIAAKETTSSGESSGETTGGSESSGSGSESSSTESGSSSGSDSGSSSSGSVSVTVTVDGSVKCTKCGKTYELKSQAENCEHYKCETCGSVYYSQEDLDACTAHVTVIFTEADGVTDANETVTKVIKSGTTVVGPAWEKDGFTLIWVTENGKEYDFDDPLSAADGETQTTVTFTAKWETTYTVTFKDESGTNADETVDVISEETVDSVPEWTREHYTLTGWTSSVEGLTVESAITSNVTFTAVWKEWSKCSVCGEYYETEEEAAACSKTVECPAAETVTVTFVDNDNGNETVTAKIFKNTSAKSSVPEWTKENYLLSWACSVDGLSTDSAITEDVTFTASWTEKPKCSNCGTYYDTETEAENCSKEEGCPKFVSVSAGTYNLSTKKDYGTVIFSKQDAGATQTVSGITVTCKIDSNGANLKTSGGEVTFTITSSMTLAFKDSAKKGVIISTSNGYIGTEGTLTSGKIGEDGNETSVTLGAGSYTIAGATSSSAKISTLTFASVE